MQAGTHFGASCPVADSPFVERCSIFYVHMQSAGEQISFQAHETIPLDAPGGLNPFMKQDMLPAKPVSWKNTHCLLSIQIKRTAR